METEHWYESKTIWGAILMLVAALLAAFRLTEQASMITEEAPMIIETIIGVVSVIAGILAFWGRLTAKTKIGNPDDVE